MIDNQTGLRRVLSAHLITLSDIAMDNSVQSDTVAVNASNSDDSSSDMPYIANDAGEVPTGGDQARRRKS
jgi:hypothetical protein